MMGAVIRVWRACMTVVRLAVPPSSCWRSWDRLKYRIHPSAWRSWIASGRRSLSYLALRIEERLPRFSAEAFGSLPREQQVLLLGYEQLREREENDG